MKPILVVDDDPSLVELVRYNLEKAGFTTIALSDGSEVPAVVEREQPDMVILDLMLPGQDGLSICRELRSRGYFRPILMLTALDTETDRVVGLEVGADDYLTKPFSPRELVARVRAVLRRDQWQTLVGNRRESPPAADREAAEPRTVVCGPLVIDPVRHEVRVDERPVPLTPTEFRILETMASEPGKAFRRDELVDRVWGPDYVGDPRVADVHVSKLRAKLRSASDIPFIFTVRGHGYRFENPAGDPQRP